MSTPAEFDFEQWWRDELRGHDCVGATPEDLDRLAAENGVSLPAAYRSFMAVAGSRCGDLWHGSDAFVPQIFGVRADAEDLLREVDVALSVEQSVVIAMHQGYEFLFCDAHPPDPPVYRFTEGSAAPVLVAERFSTLVLESLA